MIKKKYRQRYNQSSVTAMAAGWKLSAPWQSSVKIKSKLAKARSFLFCTFPQDAAPLLYGTVNISRTAKGTCLMNSRMEGKTALL